MMTLAQSRSIFWSNRKVWPGNYHGYIFLGNAVHLVGMQIFGTNWTGTEVDLVPHAPLPPFEATALSDRTVADLRQLLKEAGKAEVIGTDPTQMNQAEYETARSVTDTIRQEIFGRYARWTEAVSCLAKSLISGAVTSVLQSVNGGDFSEPLPSTDWIVHDPEVLLWRFAVCNMNETDRYHVTPFSPETHRLIYINSESLAKFQEGSLAKIYGKPSVVASKDKTPAMNAKSTSTERTRRTSASDLKKSLQSAVRYMSEKGHAQLTCQEAETQLLNLIYPHAPRERIRAVVAGTISKRQKRRPQRQLANRSKELDDCRQFLGTAM